MSDDPREIYLQPECCADPIEGRLWCEDDEPQKCEEGVPWTKYVVAWEYERLRDRAIVLEGALGRAERENEGLRAEVAHQTEMAEIALQTASEMREERDRLLRLLKENPDAYCSDILACLSDEAKANALGGEKP